MRRVAIFGILMMILFIFMEAYWFIAPLKSYIPLQLLKYLYTDAGSATTQLHKETETACHYRQNAIRLIESEEQ